MHELRPFQRSALDALSEPGHLICVSPTGSGKSLIYERAALKKGRRTLLITPLVALARQQAVRLRAGGVNTRLGAGGEREKPVNGTAAWIVSPEALLHPSNRAVLRDWKPDFLVVDECHCVWDWGDDFRPAFAGIPALIRELSISRSLWLTATLPSEARQRLRAQLPADLRELGNFGLPPSLHFTVRRTPWPERCDQLLKWATSRSDPGIVFCSTREGTERIMRVLRAAGIGAEAYHAGLSSEERRAIETAIRRSEIQVVVATSAFGMGMDYSHLGWVVLWHTPHSLLALAQAIGRVGRAGMAGKALLFWDAEDFKTTDWMTRSSDRRRGELRQMLEFLTKAECRRVALSRAFEEIIESSAIGCHAMCDFCERKNAFERVFAAPVSFV